MPDRAIILARISDARGGDERGVTDQIADGLKLATRLGWTVGPADTHHVIENDTSAFKRRKIPLPDGRHELRTYRPGFRRVLDMLHSGAGDGLVALDLDRTCRDPRDLEDLIDVIESTRPRIPVESVTGSLRLANDADITMARVMVAIANKSSRDTARRVARAKLRMAETGQWSGGGIRPYGYEADRMTIREAEAAEIRRAADAILAGVSLGQVTASLNDRKVPTAQGRGRWSAVTLRDILLRPGTAGLLAYRPDGTGRGGPPYTDDEIRGPAPWPAILEEHTWRAVAAILTDPARRNGPGPTPRYLGSGIYQCGKCADGTTLVISRSEPGRQRHARYTCSPERQRNDLAFADRRWHLSRSAARVDEIVEAAMAARLERPDAADLIQVTEAIDLPALRAEAAAMRELLDEQARLHARRLIDARQLAVGSLELRTRLADIERQLAGAASGSPLAGIAGRPDAGEIWVGLDLGRKRALLRALADVTLMPATQRGPKFDPDTVKIDWHR